MDPIQNPFSPGAGAPPPELVGRQDVLEQVRILLGRTKLGRSEKSILMTGLRGVGKTVLLLEMERMAREDGYRTILIEAHESKSLGVLLIPHLKRLLYDLDRMAGMGNKARRGLAVLKSFIGSVRVKFENVEFGLDIDPEIGTADSGDLEIDLPNLFMAIAEAAAERETSIAILIDEIQYLDKSELSALIMAMHGMQQRRMPLVLMGAGLPVRPSLAGESKSYAERLFSFPSIGALSLRDADAALQDPVKAYGVRYEEAAIRRIYEFTEGYPYFIQEWGYQSWNHAQASPISTAVIDRASVDVSRRLDENFFRVRFGRLTAGEKRFLRAMAELGEGAQRTGAIADILKVTASGLGPGRDRLIKKGMVYSPEHGYLAFTVPLFARFMKRVMPGLEDDVD